LNIIKTTRERLGLNQKDFGLLVGAHSDTISDWENSPKPPALSVERICRILLKRRRLPRPAVLVDWIRVDGGQVALERVVDQTAKRSETGEDPEPDPHPGQGSRS
jgi:DNA-binding XRE family transcriptional regulator